MPRSIPTLFLLLLPAAGLPAQAGKEAEPKIADLVARLPGADAATGRRLVAALVDRLPRSAAWLCRALAAAPPEGRAPCLHALEGMGRHLAGPGREEERAELARVLGRFLTREEPPLPVAAPLLRALQPLVGPGQVEILAPLLCRPGLADPAARLLSRAGGPRAGRVLLAALEAGEPVAPVALIHALARLRHQPAAERLLELAAGEGRAAPVRAAAARALALLAPPAAAPLLRQRHRQGKGADRRRALALLLRYARGRARRGDPAAGARICRDLLAEKEARAAALDALVRIEGAEALDELVRAMHRGGKEVRGAVAALALDLPGAEATLRWAGEVARAEGQAARAILALLARRGDDRAWPAVTGALARPEAPVREEALRCAFALRGERALPRLLAHLGKEAGAGEIEAVKQAVLRISTEESLAGVGRALPDLHPAGAAALIDALARRRARGQCPRVLAMTTHPDPRCRRAALAALAELGGAEHLPLLLTTALEAKERPERRAAARAAVALGRRTGVRAPFLAAYRERSAADRTALLALFPRLGGEELLALVREGTGAGKPERVRQAAHRALFAWPDPAAAPALLALARRQGEPKKAILALRALARLAGGGKLAPDRALALIRSAWPLARRPRERSLLLSRCASLHLEETILFLLPLLEEGETGPGARRAAVAAATIDRRRQRFLRGGPVVVAMARVIRSGSDRELAGAAREILGRQQEGAALPPDLRRKGFRPLFNGKDLSGWQGLVGNPITRASMGPEKRARAQAEADRLARAHWHPLGGILHHDGQGANLCTTAEYGDFELLLEWMIEPGGDSGIYLRGSPQVQIWDAGQWGIGSGGLYNNKRHPSRPLLTADRPPCRWNRFRIRMVGERVTVYLNGRLVTDGVVMENYWDRKRPIFPRGPIELQHHESPLYFRNIFLRRLPAQ